MLRLVPWLVCAASVALSLISAAEGSVLATSAWLTAALGWAAYGTHDAHLRRVLRKWERTIDRLSERR
jgi:uncharacterized membrane protein